MARIAGIDLPRNKRVEIGLTYIYGIGLSTAKQILAETGVDPDIRCNDLSEDDVAKLRDYIDNFLVISLCALFLYFNSHCTSYPVPMSCPGVLFRSVLFAVAVRCFLFICEQLYTCEKAFRISVDRFLGVIRCLISQLDID